MYSLCTHSLTHTHFVRSFVFTFPRCVLIGGGSAVVVLAAGLSQLGIVRQSSLLSSIKTLSNKYKISYLSFGCRRPFLIARLC